MGRLIIVVFFERGDVYGPTLAASRLAIFPVPAWSVIVLRGTAPLHAVRVRQGDAPSLRSVTLPAGPLPAFRSATWSVVRRTCHGPCFVLAALGHVPRQLLRGWRCRTLSMQQRASHPRANARLRAMSQNLRSQVLRQALRLFPRATVIGHADVHSPLPKAMNRATRGVTVHAHTLRPCHALCERLL
jgi:hypothetical protein